MSDDSSTDLREQARKRIKARRDYWQMLVIFALVAIVLNVIWWLTTPSRYYWPIWPMIGFAIAAIAGALSIFGPWSRPITDAHIDQELKRMGG